MFWSLALARRSGMEGLSRRIHLFHDGVDDLVRSLTADELSIEAGLTNALILRDHLFPSRLGIGEFFVPGNQDVIRDRLEIGCVMILMRVNGLLKRVVVGNTVNGKLDLAGGDGGAWRQARKKRQYRSRSGGSRPRTVSWDLHRVAGLIITHRLQRALYSTAWTRRAVERGSIQRCTVLRSGCRRSKRSSVKDVIRIAQESMAGGQEVSRVQRFTQRARREFDRALDGSRRDA